MALRRRNDVNDGKAVKQLLNNMNNTTAKVRLGSLLDNQKGAAKGRYSFAVQGGAVGAVNLLDEDGLPVKLPAKALVLNAVIDVDTTITSASTPTIAIGLASTDDIKGATAIASLTGVVQGVPDGAVANAVKLASEATLTATIAGTTLTAGIFYVHLEYVVSDF